MSSLGKQRSVSVLDRLNKNSEHQRQSVYWYNKKYHDRRREYPAPYEFRMRQAIEREFVEYEYEWETDAGWFDAKVIFKGKPYLFDFTDNTNKMTNERDKRKREWCMGNGYNLTTFKRTDSMSKMTVGMALVKIRSIK